MTAIQKIIQSNSDYIGSISSTLCLVHCMATPVLFVIQAGHADCSNLGPLWWSSIDYIFLVISALAVFQSARNTSSKLMPSVLFSFWVLLALGVLIHGFFHLAFFEVIKWVGAIGLVVFHLINVKYCRCAGDSCCHSIV